MKHILSVLCLLAVSFWLQLYNAQTPDAYVEVLGVAQDGGFPHMGCNKEGCNLAWEHPELRRNVSSLALQILFRKSGGSSMLHQISGGNYTTSRKDITGNTLICRKVYLLPTHISGIIPD